ncbi:MAG: toxin-activating lysine-acyltransferase, partial [Pseudomonadota bacterium]
FARALDGVIVNRGAYWETSCCVDQGPGHAPVVLLPERIGTGDVWHMVDAMSDAISTPQVRRAANLQTECRVAGRLAYLRGADWVTDLRIPRLSQPSSGADAWLWPLLTGHVRTADLSMTVPVLRIERRGCTPVDGPTDWAARLAERGKAALRDLANGALSATPTDWLAARGEEPLVTGPQPFSFFSAVGAAIEALAASTYHRQFLLDDYLSVEVLPPLRAGQTRFYVTPDNQVAGFVSWAMLDDATLPEIMETGRACRSRDWTCGTNLFFNDWITNGAPIRPVVRDVSNQFPPCRASSLRRQQNTRIRRANAWRTPADSLNGQIV